MAWNNIKSRFTKSRLDKWGDLMFIGRKQKLRKSGSALRTQACRQDRDSAWVLQGQAVLFYSCREASDKYLVGECKFKGKPFSFGEYLDTSAKLSQQKEKSDFYYMLFSESGFDDKLSAEAEKDGKIMLVDIERNVKNWYGRPDLSPRVQIGFLLFLPLRCVFFVISPKYARLLQG